MALILNGREVETALPVLPSRELTVSVSDTVVMAEAPVKTTIKPLEDTVVVLEENLSEGLSSGTSYRDLPMISETLTLRTGDYFAEDYEAQDYNSKIFTITE